MDENKIIIYQTEDGQTQIDVRLENDTVWLTQAQMAELFETDRTSIVCHINNVFKEGELEREEVCAKFAHTTLEGKQQIGVPQIRHTFLLYLFQKIKTVPIFHFIFHQPSHIFHSVAPLFASTSQVVGNPMHIQWDFASIIQ